MKKLIYLKKFIFFCLAFVVKACAIETEAVSQYNPTGKLANNYESVRFYIGDFSKNLDQIGFHDKAKPENRRMQLIDIINTFSKAHIATFDAAVGLEDEQLILRLAKLLNELEICYESGGVGKTATASELSCAQATSTFIIDGDFSEDGKRALIFLEQVAALAECGTSLEEGKLFLPSECIKPKEEARSGRSGERFHPDDKTSTRSLASDLGAKKIQPQLPDIPLVEGTTVYALEYSECLAMNEAWLRIYEGTLVKLGNDRAEVKLAKRYSVRYDPVMKGFSDKNWWCVPKKRYCWSEVDFSDWRGFYHKGQRVTFPEEQLSSTRLGMVNTAYRYIQKACGI